MVAQSKLAWLSLCIAFDVSGAKFEGLGENHEGFSQAFWSPDDAKLNRDTEFVQSEKKINCEFSVRICGETRLHST